MYKRFYLFFIFYTFSINIFAQDKHFVGAPDMKAYSFEEYNAAPQNWCIAQDKYGRMYFGNNFGLLQFDGNSWNIFPIENQSIIRSIAIDKQQNIYVGGEGEFGVFKMDYYGHLVYQKLSSDTITNHFVDVWNTIIQNDTIFFIAGHKYIYYYANNSLGQIATPAGFNNFRAFQLENKIYFVDENLGLALLENAQIKLLSKLKEKAQYNIYSLLKSNDEIFAISSLGGIYKGGLQKNFQSQKTQLDKFLIENHPYSSIKLSDGTIVIGTLLGGIVIFSADFIHSKVYDKNSGLIADGVYSVFEDKDKNIWLATENGIEFINNSSPLRKFSSTNGIEGSIKSSIYYNNILYLGTYSGLFYIDLKENERKIKSHHNEIKLLTKDYFFGLDFAIIKSPYSFKKILLASTLRSIIQIQGKKIKPVAALYGGADIEQSPLDDRYFVVSQSEGIYVFKILNKDFKIKNLGRLFGFNYDVRQLVFDKKGDLWVETARNGLAMIRIKDFEKLEYQSWFFDEKNGLENINLKNIPFFINNSILISTLDGLYKARNYNISPEKYQFKPYKESGFDFAKDSLVFNLIVQNKGEIWAYTNKGFLYRNLNGNNFRKPLMPIKDVPGESTITISDTGSVWIGAHDLLYRYAKRNKKDYGFQFDPIFTKIKINKNDFYFHPKRSTSDISYESANIYKLNTKLGVEENNIEISFTVPFFEYIDKNVYSCKLDGYDKGWSDYSSNQTVRYTNLSPGKYTFRFKVKNIYEEVSNEASISFVIKHPWYLNVYSGIVYFLFLLALLKLFLDLNSRRLVNKNKKLEDLIDKRTAEVVQQKEEIQAQTDQLKSQAELLKLSNVELRQLSLVAKGTSNSVLILDEKGNIEWWNTGFTRLFKYKFKKYKGSNFNKIKRQLRPDLEKSIEEIKETRQSKVYTIKDEVAAGEYLWFQTTVTPVFEDDGTLFRYIVIDSDITQIKLAELEINEQKSQIENQRDKIARHNREMTSSIEYASRIQLAMLPLPIFLEAIFSDYFVLNLPRDIVSGDFYWVSRFNDKTYIAVGDCTGHGIPGAFLSLLGISFLNGIIQRLHKEHISPAEILNLLRERFIVSLHQRGRKGEGQDGMDIAIIMIDSENKQVEYAGANNSIYFFNKENIALQELKADKMPIGIHANDNIPFTNNVVKLQKGDSIYLFSDGFRDQFGGEQGKKFMTKRFKQMLVNIKDYDMYKQKQVLNEILLEWKKDFEQVDDILVFGIKL